MNALHWTTKPGDNLGTPPSDLKKANYITKHHRNPRTREDSKLDFDACNTEDLKVAIMRIHLSGVCKADGLMRPTLIYDKAQLMHETACIKQITALHSFNHKRVKTNNIKTGGITRNRHLSGVMATVQWQPVYMLNHLAKQYTELEFKQGYTLASHQIISAEDIDCESVRSSYLELAHSGKIQQHAAIAKLVFNESTNEPVGNLIGTLDDGHTLVDYEILYQYLSPQLREDICTDTVTHLRPPSECCKREDKT